MIVTFLACSSRHSPKLSMAQYSITNAPIEHLSSENKQDMVLVKTDNCIPAGQQMQPVGLGCLSGPILSLGVVPVQRYLVLHPIPAPNHAFDCFQVCKRRDQRLDPDCTHTSLACKGWRGSQWHALMSGLDCWKLCTC